MKLSSIEARIAHLEAEAKPFMICTWVDLMRAAEMADMGIDVEVECSPEMQELIQLACQS